MRLQIGGQEYDVEHFWSILIGVQRLSHSSYWRLLASIGGYSNIFYSEVIHKGRCTAIEFLRNMLTDTIIGRTSLIYGPIQIQLYYGSRSEYQWYCCNVIILESYNAHFCQHYPFSDSNSVLKQWYQMDHCVYLIRYHILSSSQIVFITRGGAGY